jgi:hypothetical protein
MNNFSQSSKVVVFWDANVFYLNVASNKNFRETFSSLDDVIKRRVKAVSNVMRSGEKSLAIFESLLGLLVHLVFTQTA